MTKARKAGSAQPLSKSITSLYGVFASGIAAGIKPRPRKDLAFLYVPDACGSAGVFTRNAFVAAPLTVTKAALKRSVIKAVLINAGNANAATGSQGISDARETQQVVAQLLGLKSSEVAVASTGIIGVPLPMDRIREGAAELLTDPWRREGDIAARAIMTTDLVPKEVCLSAVIGGRRVSVAGFAKGSGMIAPNMATMLGFLVTDLAIPSAALQGYLKVAVDESFNMTSVDTDTSTNDMVLLLSRPGVSVSLKGKGESEKFQTLLTSACQALTKMIARDGEGATKLIEVSVVGARTKAIARAVAKQIINSPLVKTAIHGADPNWGRVVAAAGKDPAVKIDSTKLDVWFGGSQVMQSGTPITFNRDKVIAKLKASEVQIRLELHSGRGEATAWGCDLTHGYIDINVDYS